MNISNKQLLSVCEEAARTAGTHAKKNLHRREEVAQSFDHDVKLIMDIECQRVAEEIIHDHFPDHAILGEEGSSDIAHPVEWIIDPIDGTANYHRGLPFWCCSVAVRQNGKMAAGCIYVPMTDECFTATDDGPALLNGNPIQTSDTSSLLSANCFSGLTKDIDPRAVSMLSDLAPRVSKLRIIGCAAIDICNVACGRSDAYAEPGIYIWDVAAAGLIAERAGAAITEWPRDEEHGIRYLCTTPAIHNELKAIIESHFES